MLKKMGITLIIAVMLFMLVNCDGVTTGEETEVRLNDPATEEDTDNAAVETPDVKGVIGTATAESQEPEDDSEPVISPDAIAILVVDSFSTDSSSQDDATDPQNQDGNCIVDADGQGVYAGQGAGVYAGQGAGLYLAVSASGDYALIDTAGISHGDLVVNKFFQMLSPPDHEFDLASLGTPLNASQQQLLDNGLVNPISIWQYGGEPDLYLVQVDTQGFNTQAILERIENQLEALKDLYETTRFVVNMSFAIVPCNPEIDFDDYKTQIENDPTLNYLQTLFSGDTDAAAQYLGRSAVANAFYEPLNAQTALNALAQDPLNNFFTETALAYGDVIGVAAAGQIPSVAVDLENSSIVVGGSGKLFPYAPALWENVLSVSVMVAVDEVHIMGDYSNDGEIRREDGTVTLNNPLIVWSESGLTGTANNSYELLPATSWATPVISLAAAQHLRLGGVAECQNLRPPLAYAYSIPTPAWMNMPLQDAITNYCSSDWSGPTH